MFQDFPNFHPNTKDPTATPNWIHFICPIIFNAGAGSRFPGVYHLGESRTLKKYITCEPNRHKPRNIWR